jgi:hypothetical protein
MDNPNELGAPVRRLRKKAGAEPPKNACPVGLDIGTMNLVSAVRSDEGMTVAMFRNMFLKVDKDAMGNLNLDTMSHVEIDGELFILSDDAMNLANVFGLKVSRPMSRGMISSSEFDSAKVLGVMVGELIGRGDGSCCCYSVPANPVDADMNATFHAGVFDRIVRGFGHRPMPLQEGVAVVYSECADEDFTGLGVSCGAGMVNVGLAFKSIPVMSFSVARSGDWIDENSGNSVGLLPSRITAIKERDDFDLGVFEAPKPRERAAREALIHYYRSMISYVLSHTVRELSKVTADLPDSIPVVVSGGTSRARGFVEMFAEELESVELPFDVSSVRAAKNPMTAVAEGCLVRATRG